MAIKIDRTITGQIAIGRSLAWRSDDNAMPTEEKEVSSLQLFAGQCDRRWLARAYHVNHAHHQPFASRNSIQRTTASSTSRLGIGRSLSVGWHNADRRWVRGTQCNTGGVPFRARNPFVTRGNNMIWSNWNSSHDATSCITSPSLRQLR